MCKDIIVNPAKIVKSARILDRVKFFWEKSSAGIEWPEFGASFEQDSSSGELAYPASAPS